MSAFGRWTLNVLSVLAALLGTFLVVVLSADVYYLVSGRIQPDSEKPPLSVVVPLLITGIGLLVSGIALHRWLRKDNLF